MVRMSSYDVVLIGVGNVGRVILRVLANDDDVDKIYAVDYNIDALKKFVGTLESEKIYPLKGDIRDIDLTADIMKKGDYIINASWYEFNIHAIKAMLRAGRDMLDLGGLYWMTRKELEWDEEVRKSGLTLLLGAGDDPGTSNVLAKLAYNKLDRVNEIHIRWGSRGDGDSQFGFSIVTIMDEATMDAVAYIDGKLVKMPPLSQKEVTWFPEPIGYLNTYMIIHSELATLPYTLKGVNTITYKDSWDESIFPIIEFLKSSGFTSRNDIDILGVKVKPIHLVGKLVKYDEDPKTYGALKVEARGVKEGEKTILTYILGPTTGIEEWNAGVTAVTTAYGAVAGLKCLVNELFPRGVTPPELINDPMKWLNELVKRGISIMEVEQRIKPL
ncbi:TPA: hypothetical protein EYP83_04105 [Candidatus Geothermarchaeota archaeon]|nr:hypothetical protein [Candidatus Geothermarchaeota archaeon]